MKKLLLALMAAAALTGSAQSLAIDKTDALQAPANAAAQAMAPSRADDGYTLRFCGDINTWYRLGAAGTYMQYITIPAEIATQLAGNKLTSVSFSMTFGGADASKTVPGTVFVTEDPTASTISGMVLDAQTSVKIRDSYVVSPGYQTAVFAAGEEYVIKEDTPFSFGVMFECTTTDYPMGVDGLNANQFAGNIRLYQNDNYAGYVDMASDLGTNLMMYAVTKGEKTELIDLASVLGVSLGNFSLPIFKSTDDANLFVAINNYGSNNLTSLGYSYKVNSGQFEQNEVQIAIGPGEAKWVAIPMTDLPAGHNDLGVKLTSINGNAISSATYKLPYISLADDQAYDRKFVVEEFTGTWCGWCPRGIVGMDYMQEKYPDNFIGIAVHASSQSSSDKFQVADYLPFVEMYAPGFPGCIVNRDPIFIDDPSKDMLDLMYNYWLGQVSPAQIVVDAEVVEKELVLHAGVQFSIDDNHPYNLAFVLTEDGLTGYQTNYYAGGENGKMDGWEDKASKVSWTYTHTAIRIDDAFGLNLTESVEADYDYIGFAAFPYIGAMNRKLFKLENTHAIALLFDAETGVIVNAAKMSLADLVVDGIDDAMIAPEAPVEYYNIQGQKVANPQAGKLYIRVQDGKADKVLY